MINNGPNTNRQIQFAQCAKHLKLNTYTFEIGLWFEWIKQIKCETEREYDQRVPRNKNKNRINKINKTTFKSTEEQKAKEEGTLVKIELISGHKSTLLNWNLLIVEEYVWMVKIKTNTNKLVQTNAELILPSHLCYVFGWFQIIFVCFFF